MQNKKDKGVPILIQLRVGHLLPYLENDNKLYPIGNYTLSLEMKKLIKDYIVDKDRSSYIYIGIDGSIYIAPYQLVCQHKMFINPKKLEKSYRPKVNKVTVTCDEYIREHCLIKKERYDDSLKKCDNWQYAIDVSPFDL